MTPLPSALDTALDTLPIIDGFPYLCTRLVSARCHITPRPAGAPMFTLQALPEL